MNNPCTDDTLPLQLLQYGQDFQELLGRHLALTRRHETLQASHSALAQAEEILANLSHPFDDLCLVMDQEGNILAASPTATQLLVLDPGRPTSLLELVAPFHLSHVQMMLLAATQVNTTSVEHSELILQPGGELARWLLVDVLCMVVPAKEGVSLYWIMRDLSNRVAKGIDVGRSSVLQRESPQGIVITSAMGDILAIDPIFAKATGYSENDLLGQSSRMLQPKNTGNSAFTERFWLALQLTGHWCGEVSIVQKSGQWARHWMSVTAVKDSLDHTRAHVIAFADIDQMVRAQRTVLDTLSHDTLTGLARLPLLRDRMDARVATGWRSGARFVVVSVLLARLQWLKQTEEPDCIEAVLLSVTRRLRETVRGCDLVARTGFDQFSLLLEEPLNDPELPQTVARQVLDALAKPIHHAGKILSVHASLGCARFPQDGVDTDDLLLNSEAAMQAALGAGGDRTHWFAAPNAPLAMPDAAVANLQFAQAVTAGHLYLAYHPLLDGSESSSALVCEAQLRLKHPSHGDVPWDKLPLSTQTMANDAEATAWVFKAACEQLSLWQSIGLRGVTVVVKCQAVHLDNSAFSSTLETTAIRTGMRPGMLELALTDADHLLQHCRAWEQLRALRQCGIKIGINHLAAQSADWVKLRQIPVDHLSIEHGFAEDAMPVGPDLVDHEPHCGMGVRIALADLQIHCYTRGRPMRPGPLLQWFFSQNETLHAPLTQAA